MTAPTHHALTGEAASVGPGTVTVRRARPEEFDAVDQVVTQAYTHDYGPTHSSQDPSRLASVRSQDFDVWVAVRPGVTGDEILGSVTTRRPGGPPLQEDAADDELDLRLLAVSPDARRLGVATTLIRFVEGLARHSGARAVLLKTAPHMTQAHQLYEHLGYRREPERDGLWRGGEKVIDLHTYTRSVRD